MVYCQHIFASHLTMTVIRTFLSLHIISAYCTFASLEYGCERINRSPPSQLSYLRQLPARRELCGNCLPSYREDGNGHCIELECPSEAECKGQRRLPCDLWSGRRCGECYNYYLDMDGVCVTRPEVETLIKRIASILSPDDAVVPQSYEQAVKKVDISESRGPNLAEKTEFLDKNGSSEIVLGANPDISNDGLKQEAGTTKPAIVSAVKRPLINSYGVRQHPGETDKKVAGFNQLVFFGIVLAVSLVCIVAIIVGGVCGYRLHKKRKLAENSDYQGYGGKGDNSSVPRSESGDRRLAHSAQMYHYQHHKQNMLSLQKSMSDKMDDSETDEEHEMSGNEEGDDRVYECPGLAPTGEMEVQNPMFLVKGNSPSPMVSPTDPAHSPTSSGSSAPLSPVTSEKQHSTTSSD